MDLLSSWTSLLPITAEPFLVKRSLAGWAQVIVKAVPEAAGSQPER
jgi:hypothetical protein